MTARPVTKRWETTMPHNDIPPDLLNDPRWVLVSISSPATMSLTWQAQDIAAAMVVFEGSREACTRLADVLPADVSGVEQGMTVVPLAEWRRLEAAVTAGMADRCQP